MRAPDATGLASALGRVRWATVGMLALCAVLSLLRSRDESDLAPSLQGIVTPIALAIALGILVARQVAVRARSPQSRFRALLAVYVLCGALGVFGTFLAFAGDDGSRGALFALGGAIFALGSPPGFGPAREVG